jgi:hypothetical protein
MRIVGAAVMSDPPAVLGVNVRDVRMTFLMHGDVVLNRRIGLLLTLYGRTARRLGGSRGSRTASGNVSTANLGLATAAALLPTAPLILRKSCHAD